ncbi:MAG: cyclic nucleotide-binding domain-containing protein [gamma proteobacterium endosymbiont of Lamellibrachia anaximandri]|nr:cyclic nucleotide-binding domain-containing protein [gamma proteobacterium endosymbiont of Lamellibrachia anaximandri]
MAVAKTQKDDALLKNLVPLNTLSDEQLGQLLSRIVVEKAVKGEYLFHEGDTDHQNVYLLSGSVGLLSGKREVDAVASGTQTARFALAHQLPRKHSARAKGVTTFVRIDSRMLSDMLARSQKASYEVNDIKEQSSGDWMTLLLQSTIFQQIPPANLQRVMMRMEEVSVTTGDVIIRQGEEGDYYYLISSGRCSVARQPEQDRPPVELAQLRAGDSFGEEALISDAPRSSTVTMVTDGVLVRLSKADFVDLVKSPLSRTLKYKKAKARVKDGALWLDVRPPEEYEAGHLPESLNMPFFSLRFQASSLATDREYVVYGAQVGQAATAAYLLVERGFEVYVLDQAWDVVAPLAGIHVSGEKVDNVIDFKREAVEANAPENGQPDEDAHMAEFYAEQQRADEMQQQLEDATQEYKDALNRRQTEIKLLKQALVVARRRLDEQEQQFQETRTAHEQEVGGLQEASASAEDDQTAAAEEITSLQGKLTRLDEQNAVDQGRLKEELTGLQIELSETKEVLQETKAAAQSRAAESADRQTTLERQLQSMQQGLDRLREQSADEQAGLTRERDELSGNLGALQHALDELRADDQARQKQAEEKLAEVMQQVSAAKAAEQQLEKEKQALDGERDDLVSRLSESQREQEAHKNAGVEQDEARQAALQSLTGELQLVKDESARSAERHALSLVAQEEARESLKIDLADRDALLEEQTLTATQQVVKLEQLEQSLQEAEARQQELTGEQSELEARLTAEQERVAELKCAREDLEESRAEQQKALADLQLSASQSEAGQQAELASLRAGLDQAQAEAGDKQRLHEEVAEALSNAEETTRSLEGQKAELEASAAEQKQLADELRKSFETAQGRVETLENELRATRLAGDDADAQNQGVLAALKEELEQTQAESADRHQENLNGEAARQQLLEKQTELENALTLSEEQTETLHHSFSELETRAASLEEALSVTQLAGDEAAASFQEQQDNLLQTLEQVRANVVDKQHALEQAGETSQRLIEKKAQFKTSLKEERGVTTALRESLEQVEARATDLEQKLSSAQVSEDETAARHQEALTILQQALDDARHDINGKQQQLESKAESDQAMGDRLLELERALETEQGTTGELQQSLQNSEARAAALEGDLATAKLLVDETASRYLEERDRLQKHLDEVQGELNDKQDLLEAEQQTTADLQAGLKQLESTTATLEQDLITARKSGDEVAVQYREERDALQHTLDEARGEIENKQKLLETKEQIADELADRQSELEAALEAERQSVAGLRESQERMEAGAASLEQDLAAAKASGDEIAEQHSEQRDALQQSLENARNEIEDHQQQLESATASVDVLTEERAALQKMIEDEQGAGAELRQALELAETRVVTLEQDLASTREAEDESVARYREERDRLQQSESELQALLEQEREATTVLQVTVEETQHRSGEIEGELQALRDESAAEESERQRALELLQTEKKVVEEQLAAIETESRQQLASQKDELTQAGETLAASQLAWNEEREQLTQAQNSAERLAATLQQQLDEAKEDLEQATAARAASEDRDSEALVQAQKQITELKRTVDGLREVQLEMEAEFEDDVESEIQKLRTALGKEEKRRREAEQQAQQVDFLKRERQVQETAVEMLEEDFEGLTNEKIALEGERDTLSKQLSDLRDQFDVLMGENDQLHSELVENRSTAEDSEMADTLLDQMDQMRQQKESVEEARDRAEGQATRLKKEVNELRSVMEEYVEQIQTVQSLGADDEVDALRTELNMVRSRASEDLEQMRQALDAAETRSKRQLGRDMNEVAALQATRQELDSIKKALREKEQTLRMSQRQCRTLEDAIEDRDGEVDRLGRKLEVLLRQAGGNSRIADESEPLNGGNLHTSELEFDDSAGEAGPASLDGQETSGKRRYSLGGLFKKKRDS